MEWKVQRTEKGQRGTEEGQKSTRRGHKEGKVRTEKGQEGYGSNTAKTKRIIIGTVKFPFCNLPYDIISY